MTDWLTPEERASLYPSKSERALNYAIYRHAAEADRRLAERDAVIRELADALRKYAVFQRGAFGDYAPEYVSSPLSRVDALGIGGDDA